MSDKPTKEAVEAASDMFNDLPDGAYFQAMADNLGLEDASDVIELMLEYGIIEVAG
jgi:hypothetical protein